LDPVRAAVRLGQVEEVRRESVSPYAVKHDLGASYLHAVGTCTGYLSVYGRTLALTASP